MTTQADVVLKGGRLGRLLEPLLRLASRKMGSQSLAAFKYLVEEKNHFLVGTDCCLGHQPFAFWTCRAFVPP
ncbi:MAG: hypothetical protein ABJH99_08825, partial [Tateyamaria sp.]